MSLPATRTRVPAASGLDTALLVARVALVVIFPVSAYYKIIQWPGIVAMLTQQGAPLPLLGGYLAIAVEIGASLLVVLGLWTRWAALVLILYTLGTSIIAHRFWEFAPPQQFGQMMQFFKNLAMMGGLGLIAVLGPGRHAVQPRP
jgi:putative oxidoreductase